MELFQTFSELLLLFSGLWIVSVASIPVVLSEDSRVPEIEKCSYVNAYVAQCWWKRPKDTATVYKLGYRSASDPILDSREKYCQATQQTIDGDVIKESCAIEGTMFQRFTFWVGSVRDCNGEERSCVTTQRSKDVVFTCNKQNVILTIPPEPPNIDPEARLVAWEPPTLENSMLDFALRIGKRKVMYKVELREIGGKMQTYWEEMYRGRDTRAFLPTLIPGASYEVRVSASLDPPSSTHDRSMPPDPAKERQWTEPSNVAVLMVPSPMRVVSEETDFGVRKKVEGFQSFDEISSTAAIGNVILPLRDSSKRIIVGTSVAAFFAILIMVVVGYLAPWQRWCCKLAETKRLKPKTFVDLNGNAATGTQRKESNFFLNSPSVHEKVNKITKMNNDFVQHLPPKKTSHDTAFITAIVRGGFKASDFGQQRHSSPETDLDEALPLDHVTHVTNRSEALTNKWDINSSLMGDRFAEKYASVRYAKVQLGTQEPEMPNYLTASRMNDAGLDRFTEEYVMEEAEKEYSFTNNLSCISKMESLEEHADEKQKQWQKHFAEIDDGGTSNRVPDYVTHDPSVEADFTQNMAMFISMAAEKTTFQSMQTSVGICDSKKKLLDCGAKIIVSCNSGLGEMFASQSSSCYSENKGARSSSTTSAQLYEASEICENGERENKTQIPFYQERPTSESLPDSTYIIASLGRGLLSSSNQNPKKVDVGGGSKSNETDSSDYEADYVTYVST